MRGFVRRTFRTNRRNLVAAFPVRFASKPGLFLRYFQGFAHRWRSQSMGSDSIVACGHSRVRLASAFLRPLGSKRKSFIFRSRKGFSGRTKPPQCTKLCPDTSATTRTYTAQVADALHHVTAALRRRSSCCGRCCFNCGCGKVQASVMPGDRMVQFLHPGGFRDRTYLI
jgi:hypothetical protein